MHSHDRLVKDVLRERGQPVSGPLNPQRRLWLEDAVFQVQNDLEHRTPKAEMVTVMTTVRCVLLDEVPGYDCHPHLRWPHHDAIRAVMHAKSRRGGRGFPARSSDNVNVPEAHLDENDPEGGDEDIGG